MFRQLTIAALLLAAAHFAAGCAAQSHSFIRAENVHDLHAGKIVQITLTSGEVVRFDNRGARYYQEYRGHMDAVAGRTTSGELYVTSTAQVRQALVERTVEQEPRIDIFPVLIIISLAVALHANSAQN